MSATSLTLGDFTFEDFEIPSVIGFGGQQETAEHKLIGGKKNVDAMGYFDEPIPWSGRFRGASALARAEALQAIFRAGKAVTLAWSGLNYLVLPKGFKADFESTVEIPYSVSVVVISDQTSPISAAESDGLDEQVNDDMASATDQATTIGDPTLSGLMGTLQSAVDTVGPLLTATQAQINSILGPISAVQARAQVLIGTIGAAVPDLGGLGGVFGGGSASVMAASLSAQASASAILPALYGISSIMSRMTGNLDADGASGTVLVTGGDLYRVALNAYGDASGWADIAAANGLTDPVLAGVQTIRVPPTYSGSGGVLPVQ